MAFSLICDTAEQQAAAEILAMRFQLELRARPLSEVPYLHLSSQGLALRQPQQSTPLIYIDFVNGTARHRRLYGGGRKQPLGRAIGLKSGVFPMVCDATAGLGRDAFVLACLGCTVIMLERSPVLAALLFDALQRLEQDIELHEVSQRLQLIHQDAATWLTATTLCPEVVYLDPMYPHRHKTALVKKEMRTLQTIVGQDIDAANLLQIALQKARHRVVVKRPKGAASLLETPAPHCCINSENTRFDIYHGVG
jgi:16S rRNA (guanine1516-N2)-methyltransferase